MFNKKYIIILLLLIVSVCTLSAVCATDDVSDAVEAIEDSDAVMIDEASADDVATNSEQDLEKAVDENDAEDEKLSASEEDAKLTVDESDEALSMIFASWYDIDLYDTTISSDKKEKFMCYIDPCSISSYAGYDFNFIIYDKNAKAVYTHHYAKTTTEAREYSITIEKNTLTPGEYVMVAENTYDGIIMDSAKLSVKGAAVITASNYNAAYMSGAKMTATLTDMVTQKPLTSLSVKVVFTKGKTSITKYYTPNSNGQISFVPPLGAGTWTVTITPGPSYISGSAVKTITVKKVGVSIKAKKASEYKGYKVKLKATVKSNGKNVNEGKVKFKINGKKYTVNVKNGVATKKVKLKKVKKYKYTAKYLGTANLYKTKKVSSKATLKKRYATKIYTKDITLKVGKHKYLTFKVKTTNGKKVKNGKLRIKERDGYYWVKVKNGKAKVKAHAELSDVYMGGRGDDAYYKKSVKVKLKVKYVPGTHKYISSKSKYKVTSKFECHCGKTYTHKHAYNVYAYDPVYYTIHVV
ncbi:Ig-like domain repeat protein [Methanobrevibacter sp.]|uniref:Ig-like domain repeat protein n=1 Tax=Methanobrevibacter sp. TaxID=66852 RepID=UPI0025DA1D16|nr:Ig-like domain repeat protein [Methanobrevibacter sp.]MBR4447306.1 Ig-like domain repeat protein [Methanobrevibacter sp.]